MNIQEARALALQVLLTMEGASERTATEISERILASANGAARTTITRADGSAFVSYVTPLDDAQAVHHSFEVDMIEGDILVTEML